MSPQSISSAVRRRVRITADNRCGYCQSPQRYVLGLLEIDHIIPTARGGSDDATNLWLSCRMCNSFKGAHSRDVTRCGDVGCVCLIRVANGGRGIFAGVKTGRAS